jgi:hypothetical protein
MLLLWEVVSLPGVVSRSVVSLSIKSIKSVRHALLCQLPYCLSTQLSDCQCGKVPHHA